VSDIKKEDGVWIIDLHADDPGKSLKTVSSVRKVPLHPALIAEGFLDYVRSLTSNGPLFPDLTPDRFGRRGGNGTKLIGRWVRSLGITDKRKAPNHSWRHRFKDACRAAGIAKDVHDALTGHAAADEGSSYGLGFAVRKLHKEVSRIPIIKVQSLTLQVFTAARAHRLRRQSSRRCSRTCASQPRSALARCV
jgi:integrase